MADQSMSKGLLIPSKTNRAPSLASNSTASSFFSVPVGTRLMASRASMATTSSAQATKYRALFEKLIIKLDIVELVVKSTIHIAEDHHNAGLLSEMNSVVESLVSLRELIADNYQEDHLSNTKIPGAVKSLLDSVVALNEDMSAADVVVDHGGNNDVLFEAVRALKEAVLLIATMSSPPASVVAEVKEEDERNAAA